MKDKKTIRTGKKIRRMKSAGMIMAAIQLFVTVCFVREVYMLNVVGIKTVAVIAAVLLALEILCFVMMEKYPKKKAIVFWIISIIMSVILSLGIFYSWKTRTALSKVAANNVDVTSVSVYVGKDDPAKAISDTSSYKYGILQDMDRKNTDKAVKKTEKEIGTGLKTKEYKSITELADAMRNGEIKAIIVNDGYLSLYSDFKGYEKFPEEIRKLSQYKIENKITSAENADITKPFVMYISGIDTYGKVGNVSRSDVNILAAVNPQTGQMLLVNTPRDYYVPLSISKGVKDKLTHSGIYGIECSRDTLGMLYDEQVNHYFRLNFSGFEGMVDVLDGIDVESDVAFSSFGYSFKVGTNHLNGKQALAFARERHSFASGDNQRGKNQMKVIEAVVKKVQSPAILKNYLGVLDNLNGTFETDLSYDQLTDLVKNQTKNGTKWNVSSYSVTGTGGRSSNTYSMPGQSVYVMNPDKDMVKKGADLIDQVMSGQTPVVQ
jgi:LCP family protein required for cell wall assembly